MVTTNFPARYEEVAVLGKGGGGQVWAVRDRLTNQTVALKALAEGASEREVQALVREAVTLSGLEGLGVPKVLRFGRLPGGRRPYLVRELVEGQSLLANLESLSPNVDECLHAVVQAADQCTGLHQAALLHGDIKPANIIVSKEGKATLVDLGLAAPLREGGTLPEGLTPRYAAPELFAGMRLTVRAEIFAIGATLSDILELCGSQLDPTLQEALRAVTARAMHEDPAHRFPSADELASAIRHAAHLPPPPTLAAVDVSWPIVGLDAPANRLLSQIATLAQGSALTLEGKPGSGRSVLLRRLAWTLGVEGRDVAWVEEEGTLPWIEAIEMELSAYSNLDGVVVLVDGAEHLPSTARERLSDALRQGAKLVLVSTSKAAAALGGSVERSIMPPLEDDAAAGLVRRAIPSLSDSLVEQVIRRAEGRPGKLRAIVRRIGTRPVVSSSDIDNMMAEDATIRESTGATTGVEEIERLLDQGKLEEAALRLGSVRDMESVPLALCRTRLALGRGDVPHALEILEALDKEEVGSGLQRRKWMLYFTRAYMRLGRYAESMRWANEAVGESADGDDAESRAVTLEVQACLGLLHSYSGKHDEAVTVLQGAASRARALSDKRVESIVLGSLAVALQSADKLGEARRAFEETLEAAETAGDAGAVANTRLNLAVLASIEGDLADASKHIEAAIDMGRRAGRGATTRQALLNLAHLDLYLGRYARGRSSLSSLTEQRERLSPTQRAQLTGLEAELSVRTGEPGLAAEQYETCANAYEALGRQVDAAEARLEGVLVSARAGLQDAVVLSRSIEQAMAALFDSTAHQALLHLAKGEVAAVQNDEERAKKSYDEALRAARTAGQKEWIWRTLEARSRLLSGMGQDLAARRDREEALAVLEEIAARLTRELREVYWDDPRRRAVRLAHMGTMTSARAQSVPIEGASAGQIASSATSGRFLSPGLTSTAVSLPADERLTRLLEINRELAREHNLERLLERVTDHAITLVNAERGFVILAKDGDLVVHTSRNRQGDASHARFSRGIAERVVAGGEPVVTLSAMDDERMANYLSVHQLNVQSVACVPIRAPDNRTAGALYVETRHRPGALFHAELTTLMAFADQAAVAIENAHLLSENQRRTEELAKANAELMKARERLEELLGHRTAQLESTKRDLDATRAVLRGHFGYQGLVGTSAKARRVYALIDRVRDMDVPVLISGESGTGKEMVARAIHRAGPRAKKPFTGINCGAIPEHLLESELFGHAKGAFTGADRDRKGLFRESEGGTILLDEIGEMPHKMQAGLLRVLQEHVVRPVGGVREEPVSVRVIAATNRDLQKMVATGAFREDLYYRLHVVDVMLPPLRDRADDIPMLIDHFLNIFAARYRRERKTISRDALRFLCACPWPGNVRQLENTLLNAWVMSDQGQLELEDFETTGLHGTSEVAHAVETSRSQVSEVREIGEVDEKASRGVERSLSAHQATEKDRILAALAGANWNRVKAAEMVGIPRRTFYRRLKKYGIQ
jgi:transcriptional regulator with GAF, ATPase, and Fis domain